MGLRHNLVGVADFLAVETLLEQEGDQPRPAVVMLREGAGCLVLEG